jgi:hypothetical protein
MKWVEPVAHMGEMINEYKILVGKHERKRRLGRPGRRWEDNIKIYHKEIVCEDSYWANLA